uniref:Col_cuticle_N domain-containing protein n=1 Tax=Bursaphelenchus xylophilus TaxID=6326 RepID=A0A1I7RVU4_BURXY
MLWNRIFCLAVAFILASADDPDAEEEDGIDVLIIVLVSVFGGLVFFVAVSASILFFVTYRAHKIEEQKELGWLQNKSKVMKKLVPSDYFRPPGKNQPPKPNDPTKPSGNPPATPTDTKPKPTETKKEEKNKVEPGKAAGKKFKSAPTKKPGDKAASVPKAAGGKKEPKK